MPIVMSSRRPAALRRGATPNARSAAVKLVPGTARNREQCANACRASTGLNAPQPLSDEHAIVDIERHHVRDGAERHEIQILRGARRARRRGARFVQHATHGHHHVERDANARQCPTPKLAGTDVWIHDDIGGGQLGPGQMVIGDQHVDTMRARIGNAGDAGDAIVDRDYQRRAALSGERDDLRREPVAELEAIGHEKIDGGEAPRAQRAHDERRAGGAIRIEVPDDEHASVRAVLNEQRRRGLYPFERADR